MAESHSLHRMFDIYFMKPKKVETKLREMAKPLVLAQYEEFRRTLERAADIVQKSGASILIAGRLKKENALLLAALKKVSFADHPTITDMNDAAELGRRLTTAAQIARDVINQLQP